MAVYYDAWDSGAFSFQRPLCQALQSSSFALDDPAVNPLTLRLVTAHQASNDLYAVLRRAREGLPPQWQPAVAFRGEGEISEDRAPTGGSLSPSISISKAEAQTRARAALVKEQGTAETRRFSGHKDLDFPAAMEAQRLLFQFFVGFGAALDSAARSQQGVPATTGQASRPRGLALRSPHRAAGGRFSLLGHIPTGGICPRHSDRGR